ncbi:DUF2971 domain-containing protein [Edwardsiella tarda]|uniref:DUF2971 domain-containing protein n=1 Tax=Edwardsiella tarda TaxID=636 RepID=UPI00351C34C0
MANLYKYMSPTIANVLLVDDSNFSIKFSQLNEYNDPYEFFLTIDYRRPPRELAFYNEMIGMVLKQPTTCFSKRPEIIPMWAHYANNSTGFVIEIDEEKLQAHISTIGVDDINSICDINYRDTPKEGMEQHLQRAYQICKPRYIAFLQQHIRYSAYLLKKTCWSYEQERRLIINEDALTKINENLMILPTPLNCIKSIIIGNKADRELEEKLLKISSIAKCNIYKMIIGKSTTSPYFIDHSGNTFIFDGDNITREYNTCRQCHEPVDSNQRLCSWCSISEEDKSEAAYRNTFRALDSAGILEDYLKKF